MADLTLNDVVKRVLQRLYVLERGETPENEDAAIIEEIVARCVAELRGRNIWDADDDAYPDTHFEAFADYVACYAAADYPTPRNIQTFTEAYKMLKYAELQEFSELYVEPTPDATYATIV